MTADESLKGVFLARIDRLEAERLRLCALSNFTGLFTMKLTLHSLSITQLPSKLELLQSMRTWLDSIEVQNVTLAKYICKLIPASCPFEHDINFLHRTIIHIPSLCKLNPLYNQLIALRFRALCYLAVSSSKSIRGNTSSLPNPE